jgi:hypothetical protein
MLAIEVDGEPRHVAATDVQDVGSLFAGQPEFQAAYLAAVGMGPGAS